MYVDGVKLVELFVSEFHWNLVNCKYQVHKIWSCFEYFLYFQETNYNEYNQY